MNDIRSKVHLRPGPLVGLLFLAVLPVATAEIHIIQEGTTNANTFLVGPTDTSRFDEIMRTKAVENETVFIHPGTYLTRGYYDGGATPTKGFTVRNGARIYGAGATKPILRLVEVPPAEPGKAPENVVLYTTRSVDSANISITNLVIDCNASNLTANMTQPMHIYGVQIASTNNASLIGIDVTGACNDKIDSTFRPETWILSILTDRGLSLRNLIKGCTVSNFFNPTGYGACSAISLNRFAGDHNYTNGYIEGRVEDCVVHLGGWGGEFAYNATKTVSCVFSNNKAIHAQRGFNNDTPYNRNLVFKNNTIILTNNVAYGMYLYNDTEWARIYENNVQTHRSGATVFTCGGAHSNYWGATNILFDHNTITVTGTGANPDTYGFSLYPAFKFMANRINVENNLLNPNLTNAVPSSVGYYVRNTNGTGFPAGANGVNLGWRYTPCRADLNLDASVDLLLQDAGYYLATAFMTNGIYGPVTNVTQITPSYPNGNWKCVGSGDINRDGRTDLFLQLEGTWDVGYWIMADTFITRPGILGGASNPGQYWRVKATGDFNNDNKVDLVFQHDLTGSIKLWLLNETSYYMEPALSHNNPGLGYKLVGAGDFNNNGFDDMLFQSDEDGFEGELLVWLMDGATRLSQTILIPDGTSQPEYQVVAIGEFGAYGGSPAWHTDILFQNRSSGALRLWFMSNTTRVSSLDLGGPGGTYKVMGPK